jgi:hypothetical protein
MIQISDPVTRQPLPAFKADDLGLRRLGGAVEWLGEHDPDYPSWERSTVSEIGFQYIRRCARPCVHLAPRSTL